jgi:tRNA threonylcarbamoyladenosine biosynthesis protein TsaE
MPIDKNSPSNSFSKFNVFIFNNKIILPLKIKTLNLLNKTISTTCMISKIENLAAWQPFAQALLAQIKQPILLLYGDLGAGKTTFSQQLLKAIGCTDQINSPTYSIVNEYQSPKGTIYHFDLYRIKNIAELDDIGFEEYLDNAYLCLIEWPDIYEPYWPQIAHHKIHIKNLGKYREVNFQ